MDIPRPAAARPRLLVLAACAMAASCAAQAATITFASLPAEIGTAVTPVVGGPPFDHPMQYILPPVYGPAGNRDNLLADLMTNAAGDDRYLTLSASRGGLFSICSFTAAQVNCCPEDNRLIVTGDFADGPGQTLTIGGFAKAAFKSHVRAGTGLRSVTMRSVVPYGGYMAFKSFETSDPNAVPEPNAAALVASALGLLVVLRRGRAAS